MNIHIYYKLKLNILINACQKSIINLSIINQAIINQATINQAIINQAIIDQAIQPPANFINKCFYIYYYI